MQLQSLLILNLTVSYTREYIHSSQNSQNLNQINKSIETKTKKKVGKLPISNVWQLVGHKTLIQYLPKHPFWPSTHRTAIYLPRL